MKKRIDVDGLTRVVGTSIRRPSTCPVADASAPSSETPLVCRNSDELMPAAAGCVVEPTSLAHRWRRVRLCAFRRSRARHRRR